MYTDQRGTTSNFEATTADIVNTKAGIGVDMESNNSITKIDEEQQLDRATAEQLAKIVQFLLNIED